jgi:hypothetical protein
MSRSVLFYVRLLLRILSKRIGLAGLHIERYRPEIDHLGCKK